MKSPLAATDLYAFRDPGPTSLEALWQLVGGYVHHHTAAFLPLDPVRRTVAAVILANRRGSPDVGPYPELTAAIVNRIQTIDIFGVCPVTIPCFADSSNIPRTVTTHKLHACICPKDLDALRDQYGIDVSDEQALVYSAEVALEIDRYHINSVLEVAPKVLLDKVTDVAQSIVDCACDLLPYFKEGGSIQKWVVAPTEVCNLFREEEAAPTGMGLRRVPTGIPGYPRIYEDPFMPPNVVLCGSTPESRGAQNAAAVWYPYGITFTPTVLSADDFRSVKHTLDRSVFSIVDPTAYRAIHIRG